MSNLRQNPWLSPQEPFKRLDARRPKQKWRRSYGRFFRKRAFKILYWSWDWARAPQNRHASTYFRTFHWFFSTRRTKSGREADFIWFYDTREPEELFHVEQFGEKRLGWEPGFEPMSCWTTYTALRRRRLLKTICTYRRCIRRNRG